MKEINDKNIIDIETLRDAVKEAEKARSKLRMTLTHLVKRRNKELLKSEELQDEDYIESLSQRIIQITDLLYPEFDKQGE